VCAPSPEHTSSAITQLPGRVCAQARSRPEGRSRSCGRSAATRLDGAEPRPSIELVMADGQQLGQWCGRAQGQILPTTTDRTVLTDGPRVAEYLGPTAAPLGSGIRQRHGRRHPYYQPWRERPPDAPGEAIAARGGVAHAMGSVLTPTPTRAGRAAKSATRGAVPACCAAKSKPRAWLRPRSQSWRHAASYAAGVRGSP